MSANMWKRSTVWRRTMFGFPAGWVTITRDETGSFAWEVVLVDLSEPITGRCVGGNLRIAKREALAAWADAGGRLMAARGGS